MRLLTVSSLEKVFKTDEPSFIETSGLMLRNEVYNFQAVFIGADRLENVSLKISSKAFDVVKERNLSL